MSLDINLTGVEKTSNKKTNLTDNSDIFYPTQKAVKTAVDAKFNTPTGTTSQYLRGDGSLATFPTIPSIAGLVPETRTINGLDLSANRTLTASDVGAPSGSGSSTGTNTGDETKTSIQSKLGIFEAKLTSGNQTTTTNASQIAITELKVTPSINKRYKVTVQLHLGCSGSGGVRVGITIPTGASIFITGFGTGQPGATNSIMSFITASAGLFQNPYVIQSSSNGMCIINGEIEMGATAGDVQLRFASVTGGQTSTVFQLGSHLQLEEI